MHHVSTHLDIDATKSFYLKLQRHLDNFNGRAHHPRIPTRPTHIKSIQINLDLHKALDLTTVYALLDHLQHVRCLELHATLSTDQLDLLERVCQDIHVRLPNVMQLALHSEWIIGDDWPSEELDAMVYKHMIGDRRLTSLDLWHAEPLDGAIILDAQAPTLVELDISFPVLVNLTSGFRVASFPRLKRLLLHSTATPTVVPDLVVGGHMLDFGKSFPSLEYLYMATVFLGQFGGEELGRILYMTSTCPHLKHLRLDMSPSLTARSSIPSIAFNSLETLVLSGPLFKEEHLLLLAAVQWPSLMSIRYGSDGIYPDVISCLLVQAPRLKWLTARIHSNQEFFPGLLEMFGEREWPNLLGVCVYNQNAHMKGSFPDYVQVMKKACPNATIHLKFKRGIESRLFYGVHLPPQCGWGCYKCATN
jgi:hypothetical protein